MKKLILAALAVAALSSAASASQPAAPGAPDKTPTLEWCEPAKGH